MAPWWKPCFQSMHAWAVNPLVQGSLHGLGVNSGSAPTEFASARLFWVDSRMRVQAYDHVLMHVVGLACVDAWLHCWCDWHSAAVTLPSKFYKLHGCQGS